MSRVSLIDPKNANGELRASLEAIRVAVGSESNE
jgi:hypothetical protein